MLLLAQTEFNFGAIAQYLVDKGPATAFFMLALYLIWVYGPKLTENHTNLIKTLEECTEKNTESLATIAQATRDAPRVAKMLGHMAEAGKVATTDVNIHRHLDRALDERDRD